MVMHMEDRESETRQCPFCKEDIKQAATRCKHCLSTIPAEVPGHGGVCPFCKEDINVEAVRCPHCAADFGTYAQYAGRRRGVMPGPFGPRARKAVTRRPAGPQQRSPLFRSNECEGCADTDTDEAGTWTLLECSEHFCIYELTDPVPPSPYGVFR
jgi:hypothetical protein